MRRAWWITLTLAGLTVAAIVVFALRDTTTPVDAETVGDSFHDVVGINPGDPGIYSFATVGYEAIDALSGARHDYPATTYVTISDGPCGPIVRWQALQERWVEWSHCGPDLSITETLEYHEWFGVPDEETEHCADPRPVFAEAAEVVCVAAGSTEIYQVELAGTERIEVDGEVIDAVHIRRISALAGDSSGETVAEIWRLVDTPLPVRMQLTSLSTSSSAIGDVTYREEVTLDLLNLLPQG
jgi:hypothetical protein